MLAFFFYIDGVHTVIKMSTSYGTDLGIDSTQLVLALLVTQFVAFPSAIAYGNLAKRFGTKRMLKVGVLAYFFIVLFAAFFLKSAVEFWILAICVGLFQGGIQALSRSEYGKLIPKERANEYYGFFDIFARPLLLWAPSWRLPLLPSLTGSSSLGVLSIAPHRSSLGSCSCALCLPCWGIANLKRGEASSSGAERWGYLVRTPNRLVFFAAIFEGFARAVFQNGRNNGGKNQACHNKAADASDGFKQEMIELGRSMGSSHGFVHCANG